LNKSLVCGMMVPLLFLLFSGVPCGAQQAMSITKKEYGKTADGKTVHEYTLQNPSGMRVKLITYGAIVTSVETPDKNGKLADCVFGFDDVAGYESKGNGYFGATVGRVGNRIAKGRFKLDGKEYKILSTDDILAVIE
jgi:aldose 1-epimerase